MPKTCIVSFGQRRLLKWLQKQENAKMSGCQIQKWVRNLYSNKLKNVGGLSHYFVWFKLLQSACWVDGFLVVGWAALTPQSWLTASIHHTSKHGLFSFRRSLGTQDVADCATHLQASELVFTNQWLNPPIFIIRQWSWCRLDAKMDLNLFHVSSISVNFCVC